MWVRDRRMADKTVVSTQNWRSQMSVKVDRLFLQPYLKRCRTQLFSTGLSSDNIVGEILNWHPDVVHLHWINFGLLNIWDIGRFNRPIVWTLHDQWAFTGGCHYSADCKGYESQCGACPQLGSRSGWDLSRLIHSLKKSSWKNLNLHIVTPSEWLADCARRSTLLRNFPITVIPNSIDPRFYFPRNKNEVRQKLGLPIDKKIILFGAEGAFTDPRKGGVDFVKMASRVLLEQSERCFFATFGEPCQLGTRLGYPGIKEFGRVSDEMALAELYSAADVVVVPSSEDNFPNTILESHACGTRVVAYAVGGIPEMIPSNLYGNTVPYGDISKLAEAVEREIFQTPDEWELHHSVQMRCGQSVIGNAHDQLYRAMV